MNIACDARSLVGTHTGVATWVTHVMAGLADDYGHAVTLTASKPIVVPDQLRLDNVRVLPPTRPTIPGTLWLQTVLPRWLAKTRPDIFVGSLAVLPRRCPVPAISVVHDLTPRTHPEHHTLTNRFCFNAYLEESLEQSDAVVAVSQATASVLLDHMPIVRSKLIVISNGVDPSFSPPRTEDDGRRVREEFSGGRPYLLHLGTIEPRKGVTELVAAWEVLQRTISDPPDLIVAGGFGWNTTPIVDRIQASPYRDGIHLPGYVTSDAARDLMRHAEAFVTASEIEGFGLPLAEAISCGTACVASDIAALRETGGAAPLYVPPGDIDALARALRTAIAGDMNATLRDRSARRAPDLRWDPIVERWSELLGDVAGA
jgi:glycosyltransferase involved in cell wall biosynthesis